MNPIVIVLTAIVLLLAAWAIYALFRRPSQRVERGSPTTPSEVKPKVGLPQAHPIVDHETYLMDEARKPRGRVDRSRINDD